MVKKLRIPKIRRRARRIEHERAHLGERDREELQVAAADLECFEQREPVVAEVGKLTEGLAHVHLQRHQGTHPAEGREHNEGVLVALERLQLRPVVGLWQRLELIAADIEVGESAQIAHGRRQPNELVVE